jgi:serine phosphatase RsbU (regulator of sigma subunit)
VVGTDPPARFSTVACAELDPATGRLTYACAGHLPPVLASGTGVELLWDGRSGPLGVRSSRPREEAYGTVAPGATLWLYTDGLVEQRGEGLRAGLGRLAAAVAAADGDVQHAVEAVARVLLRDAPHEDDVCVVAERDEDEDQRGRGPAATRVRSVAPAAPGRRRR